MHTQTFPQRLEAGTINLIGIIGLSAGLEFVISEGISSIHRREMELLMRLREGLSGLNRVKLHGMDNLSRHVRLLTISVDGMDPEDVSAILDGDFGIAVRAGLHCAPFVHRGWALIRWEGSASALDHSIPLSISIEPLRL